MRVNFIISQSGRSRGRLHPRAVWVNIDIINGYNHWVKPIRITNLLDAPGGNHRMKREV